jgi:hypothetical protein
MGGADNQPDDGLGQPKPSTADEVVRRGQEALRRLDQSYNDWMDIAEALHVGRTEVMAAVHTNKPMGKRYAKAMGDWLFARGFHVIDPCTRSHLLECLEHRAEIEKSRALLTEGERLKQSHPTTVLRKWKASTVPPKPKKPSEMAKLREAVARLEEENYRMREEIKRSGGDLWNKGDRAERIRDAVLALLKPCGKDREMIGIAFQELHRLLNDLQTEMLGEEVE